MALSIKRIGFQYSNDGGATWSTALPVQCLEVDVYKLTEAESTKKAASGRIWEVPETHLMVDILTDVLDFDPARTAAAEANWEALQAFCAARLRRIYNYDTTAWPTLDEHDELNSASNTVYMNLEGMQVIKNRMDKQGANTMKSRQMELHLKSRDIVQ